MDPGDSSPAAGKTHERLLSEAIKRARLLRRVGVGDSTLIIMREVLQTAVRRSTRKFKATIGVLALALIAVTAYGAIRIQGLKQQKGDVDAQIRDIETRLGAGGQDPAEIDRLIERLNRYQDQAQALQGNLLFRLGVRGGGQAFVEREIKTLLAEFGAESYSIPPEFTEQVNRFIQQYQERDRANVERIAGRARQQLETIRRVFESERLPPDLAYMVLVESAFISENASPAGAVGLWQFTPATARAYGMKVNERVDERLDLRKSTLAASRYIRELILDFGSGSSVMLALAAYNVGPGKVKQAVRKVDDPIKQRNFWYLYRVRALPLETREYVPKIIAAIIIGRNLERFGF